MRIPAAVPALDRRAAAGRAGRARRGDLRRVVRRPARPRGAPRVGHAERPGRPAVGGVAAGASRWPVRCTGCSALLAGRVDRRHFGTAATATAITAPPVLGPTHGRSMPPASFAFAVVLVGDLVGLDRAAPTCRRSSCPARRGSGTTSSSTPAATRSSAGPHAGHRRHRPRDRRPSSACSPRCWPPWSRVLAGAVVPVVVVLAATPLVALFPLFARVLGYEPATVRALAAVMVFFPVFVYTRTGLLATPRRQRRRRRRASAPAAGTPSPVLVFPAAVPHMATGCASPPASSVIAAVVGESLIGRQGLGVEFSYAYSLLNLPRRLRRRHRHRRRVARRVRRGHGRRSLRARPLDLTTRQSTRTRPSSNPNGDPSMRSSPPDARSCASPSPRRSAAPPLLRHTPQVRRRPSATLGRRPTSHRHVRTAFNWVPAASGRSWYLAEANGVFSANGIDSELLHGGPNTPAVAPGPGRRRGRHRRRQRRAAADQGQRRGRRLRDPGRHVPALAVRLLLARRDADLGAGRPRRQAHRRRPGRPDPHRRGLQDQRPRRRLRVRADELRPAAADRRRDGR